MHSHVIIEEASNTTQEEYTKLYLISYLQSEIIPSFEASLRRSNVVAQMSQQLPYINLQIGEGQISPNMFGLNYTGSGLSLVNLDYHQSVSERKPNLVLKFVYLEDLDDVDSFNINGVDGGKEKKQGKLGVDVTTLITYKNTSAINGQLLTFSLTLG